MEAAENQSIREDKEKQEEIQRARHMLRPVEASHI